MEYTKPNGLRGNYEILEIDGTKLSVDNSEFHILAEKYRPRIVEDLVLPAELQKMVQNVIKSEQIPNMLFFSVTGGTGKDSIISVLKAQVPMTMLTINASIDRNIDTVRTKIMQFVGTPSMDGTRKVCYLTEAGGMTSVAMDSLKSVIEDYSGRVSFIMTTNSMENITHALKSRFQFFDMNHIPKEERNVLAKSMFMRLNAILKNESVTFTNENLLELLMRHFPSYRELMNAVGSSIKDKNLVVTAAMAKSVLNQVIGFINAGQYAEIVRISESINVPSFAQTINHLHYVGLLQNENDFLVLIPALNDLQMAISKAVPFPNVSFCLFCLMLIKSKVQLIQQP